MVYNEETAAKLKEKGVSYSTLRTWKQRGKIPDSAIAETASQKTFQRIQKVLRSECIRNTQLSNVPRHVTWRIVKGSTNQIARNHADAIRTGINDIKKLIRKYLRSDKPEDLTEVLASKKIIRAAVLRLAEEPNIENVSNRIGRGSEVTSEEAARIKPVIIKLNELL